MPGDIDYTQVIDLDLGIGQSRTSPAPSGRKTVCRCRNCGSEFSDALKKPVSAGGYAIAPQTHGGPGGGARRPQHGDIVIAAMTSCTNTSNPAVMVMAGLVAKKAVEHGLDVKPWVKTSLTPGSRVVSKYLQVTGLQTYLDRLGFNVAGYSCGTCVGASGPIDPNLETAIMDDGIVACAVLSGNRNFESRIHPAVRAAFLASPPLVVAFALVGSVNVDVDTEPLGVGKDGEKVYLRDLWPSTQEVDAVLAAALRPDFYREAYGGDMESLNPLWGKITQASGEIFPWEDNSSYIKEPPFLASPLRNTVLKNISGARALAILGNSVTTDHISPIGSIKASSPAGQYLQALGVKPSRFQQLRRAPDESRGDDPRRILKLAAEEFHGAGRRRRRHRASARRQANEHL